MKTTTNAARGTAGVSVAKVAGLPAVLLILLITSGLQACTDFFAESKSKDQPRSETVQGPLMTGKVMNALRGGGYTYMQLENNGHEFWVASSVINVKRNDQVSWEGGTVMTNFTSYALNKRFDEIHFVRAIKIDH